VAKILIVEDEPDMRFLLRLILDRDGFDVSEANNGAEALQRVEESIPDIVITDLMMPVMSGRELIQHLRSNPSTARIPILSVSAHPEALYAGADLHLAKPVTTEALLEATRNLLAREATSGAD
jgi:CheY-like chemotaxis protein